MLEYNVFNNPSLPLDFESKIKKNNVTLFQMKVGKMKR